MSIVLVVDDDADLRETLCDVLQLAGHDARAAKNGEEALRFLRNDPHVDLVVLDLMMPVMTGWEFRVEQLADAALAQIPVVVMTAAADLLRSPIAAAQILSKPVPMKALLAAIDAHARTRT